MEHKQDEQSDCESDDEDAVHVLSVRDSDDEDAVHVLSVRDSDDGYKVTPQGEQSRTKQCGCK